MEAALTPRWRKACPTLTPSRAGAWLCYVPLIRVGCAEKSEYLPVCLSADLQHPSHSLDHHFGTPDRHLYHFNPHLFPEDRQIRPFDRRLRSSAKRIR